MPIQLPSNRETTFNDQLELFPEALLSYQFIGEVCILGAIRGRAVVALNDITHEVRVDGANRVPRTLSMSHYICSVLFTLLYQFLSNKLKWFVFRMLQREYH